MVSKVENATHLTVAHFGDLMQNVMVNVQLTLPIETQSLPRNANELSALLGMENASIFVILEQSRFKFDESLICKIRSNLNGIKFAEKALHSETEKHDSVYSCSHYIFAIEGKAVERCRDKLKEIFFEYFLKQASSEKLFSLSEYIDFIVSPKKPSTEMVEHTFVHGIGRFYRFLFNSQKLAIDIASLREFLGNLPQNCPNHLFLSGPKASKGEWAFPVVPSEYKDCDLIQLAHHGSQFSLMKRAHENIEKFLMLHDSKTFACEIPIWLQPSDFSDYQERFKTASCITGHIDILRFEEDGQIGLWDYKPKARTETAAANQVWFYIMMLSKRTGIPMNKIKGGYFDEFDAYLIKPT